MKKVIFACLAAALVAGTFSSCKNTSAEVKNDVDSISYAAGVMYADGLIDYQINRNGLDSAYISVFIKGIKDGAVEKTDKEKAYNAGLQIGAGLEDLGKGHRSQVGTIYSTKAKGPRYLELTEGYITEIALDEDDEIIGYKYINLGVMLDAIKDGVDPLEAIENATGQYGRFDDAAKKIDPRSE